MNYDIDPEARARLLEDGVFAKTETVAGITLRRPTLESDSLHTRLTKCIENPDNADITFIIAAFIYIHDIRNEDVMQHFAKPSALVPRVAKFMAQMESIESLTPFSDWFTAERRRLLATQTMSSGGPEIDDPKA